MKIKFTVILMAMALVAACGGNTPDAQLDAHDQPIINGELPDEPMHDAVVSLHQRDGDMWSPNIFCSGTLVAPDVVVTAAHCLDSGRHPRKFTTMAPEELLVFVGDNPVDWANGGGAADDELHAVSETLIHPSYDKNAITNDIALVRLSSASAHTTVPNLPASLGFTAADEGVLTLNFAGFGEDENGNYDQKLQIDGVLDHIQSASQIYYVQNDGGPCFGDSGGPAFVKRDGVAYLSGVTSYGDSYCAQYGVSTRADAYETFINDFIGTQTSYCGDGVCDADEDCSSCEADCGACEPVCGDGVCDSGEDCSTCEADCGPCPYCGDGTCDADEDCASCEADCGPCPYCGDGTCDADEDCASCETDCGPCPYCGDGVCDADEDCSTCETDCGACPTAVCGDGVCAGGAEGEDCNTCPADCPYFSNPQKSSCCGDGICGWREDASNCPCDC
jgi:V8-like Glu-specific endopeptidase